MIAGTSSSSLTSNSSMGTGRSVRRRIEEETDDPMRSLPPSYVIQYPSLTVFFTSDTMVTVVRPHTSHPTVLSIIPPFKNKIQGGKRMMMMREEDLLM